MLLYGGNGTGELAEAGSGVRQWALCKISMKDSVGLVIWIPSALSPYDLLSAQVEVYCTSTAGPTSTCWWWISTRWTWTLSAHNRSNYLTKCVYVLIDRFQVLFVAVLMIEQVNFMSPIWVYLIATVIDARRRTSCSLGGYESPWAPGGAIFIPGEIMTRREYWKPFFSQLNQF